MFSRNICIWCPSRGRVVLRALPRFDPFFTMMVHAALFWVSTYKSNEFLHNHSQDMLRDEGIQFQVCSNPDLKCAVVESGHRWPEIEFSNFLHPEIPTAILTFCRNLSRLQWHSSHDYRYGAVASDRCWRPRNMASDGGQVPTCSNCDGQV